MSESAQEPAPETAKLPTSPIAAASWGIDSDANKWIERQAKCIEPVQAMKDRIDVALLGDSISQGLGGG